MSEWESFRIKDFGKVVTGKTPPTVDKEFYNKGYKFVTPTDLDFNSYYIRHTQREVSEKARNRYPNYFLPPDSVSYTCIGATIGKSCLNREYVLTNQQINSIIPNKSSNARFIYYYLNAITPSIVAVAGGAATPIVNKSSFESIKINVPPLPTQQKIAKILSNYDDLIENNLKRIKLLEESARLTYEEWFLRFRIDGKKLEIDSDTGLPFGWECKLMKDFGEVVTGKTPSTDNESYYGGDIPFVKTPSMHGNTYTLETADYLTNLGANSQQNKFLSKNSLMVSCIGTAGVYSLVAGNCQTNQQINSIRFYKDEYTFYIYGFAGHLTNVLDAIGSNGATMTNVNKTKFENIKAPMPSIDLLERFHNTFNSNFESILNIMKQNQLLKEARDILLPRLMTGMIDTDDMDIAI